MLRNKINSFLRLVMCFFIGHDYDKINEKESLLWLNKHTGGRVKLWTDKCKRCGKEMTRTDIP